MAKRERRVWVLERKSTRLARWRPVRMAEAGENPEQVGSAPWPGVVRGVLYRFRKYVPAEGGE